MLGVALSPDGKLALTASWDGSVRIWDGGNGKELCRLYSLEGGKDWLVITPEGRFDGSPGAWDLVGYRMPNGRVVHDDATLNRYHRPALLSSIWNASGSEAGKQSP